MLSGGQKQRIGIARALYNNPDILIFDEATSALDSNTEIEVMNSIDKLKREKTLILVAHRLSTLKNCDKIFTLEKGRIIKIEKYILNGNSISNPS
jgi:ABC-type bacteriocin/lantibiotic exporter with double-glycine peptidase domain